MRHVLLLTAVLVACSSDASSPAPQDARSAIDGLIEVRPEAAVDLPMGADLGGGAGGAFDGAATSVDLSGAAGGAHGTGGATGGRDASLGTGGSTSVTGTGGRPGTGGTGRGLDGAAGSGGVDAPADADAPTKGFDAAPAEVGPVQDPWLWVVVQDTEQRTCTSNAPGADIDAVALLDGRTGNVLGWGRGDSAHFTANPNGNACENADCSGGNCKYAVVGGTFEPRSLVALTEGPPDGVVSATANDSGYLALNGGTLQVQIGSATDGTGPARSIASGDQIMVYEMDKTYITSGAAPPACSCLPEHYTVGLQTAIGQYVQLRPTRLAADNTTCAALTATTTEGCGSTAFTVP